MNTSRASILRVHDAMLGGNDNTAADRMVRDRLLAVDQAFPAAHRDARDFLTRAVRYLAREAGITQFLDCGLRLPITENAHADVHPINPGASVVYVSVDHQAVADARAHLAGNDRAHVTEVNISRADRVLSDRIVRGNLDLSRPVGLLHALTLHHIPDHDDPWLTMAQYVDGLASGSYVVISHMLDPGPDHDLAETIARVGKVYRGDIGTGWPRTAERILDLLPGMEVLGPGLVPVGDWRPDGPRRTPLGPMQRLFVGAVGRKP